MVCLQPFSMLNQCSPAVIGGIIYFFVVLVQLCVSCGILIACCVFALN
jgi:hypothetical protein